MDTIVTRWKAIWKQYKYVMLILLIGIIFMMIPSKKKTEAMPQNTALEAQEKENELEKRLQEILSQIDGVGKVSVMLTTVTGEETVYQTDGSGYTGESQRQTTIIVNRSDRSQYGLIRQVNPPIYLGAVVVCQGGGKSQIKMAVTEAVAKATGLTANHITVLKMK